MNRKISIYLIIIFVVTLGFLGTSNAEFYEFQLVIESTGSPNDSIRGLPAINNNGVVAYWDFQTLFTYDGTTNEIISASSTPYSSLSFYPSINDNNVLGFGAFPVANEWAVLASDGSFIDVYLDTLLVNYSNIGSTARINNNAKVAGWAKNHGLPVIYVSDESTVTTIADTSGTFSTLFSDVSINDNDDVAFMTHSNIDDKRLVVVSDGINSTIVADNIGEFYHFNFGKISLNNSGKVAFRAALDDGGQAVVAADTNAVTIIADTSGGFDNFHNGGFDGVSINNNDKVAFWASFKGEAAIYTNAISGGDKVIGVGDTLNGDTIVGLSLGDEALNDLGQIVFRASIIDESGTEFRAIYIANPISVDICDPNLIWKNHGQYVACVINATGNLVDQEVITEEEGKAIIKSAAISDVGKK